MGLNGHKNKLKYLEHKRVIRRWNKKKRESGVGMGVGMGVGWGCGWVGGAYRFKELFF